MAKIDATTIRAKAEQITTAQPAMKLGMAKVLRVQVDALTAQLNTQYAWLNDHPNHPQVETFEAQWIADLQHYEAACDVLAGIATQQEIAA
jgi:hypothetical protein